MAVLLQRARILIHQGRYEDAFTALRQHLSQYAHDTDALFLLAICYLETNSIEEASEVVANTIGLAPYDDRFLYLQSKIFFLRKQYNDAINAIAGAVAINPQQSDYFGTWAQILLFKKDYAGALQKTEEGLAINPEDEFCLNLRSNALFNLGKKEAAFSHLHEALEHNPENAYTHANLGWKWLETGEHRKALEHFREALKLDPNNDWARNGMVQAMKAKYWLYRQFLNYAFFMGRQKAMTQWIIIIAVFVLTQIASRVYFPVYVLLALLAVSTWLIVPVSNLFLRLNPYGRYALSAEQVQVSNAVGILLSVALLAGITWWITGIAGLLALCIAAAVMLLPSSALYVARGRKSRRIVRWYVGSLAAIGLLGVIWAFMYGDPFNIFLTIMLIGVFLFQILANYMLSKED
ncbi:tetratricopeptide repeat protein [Chitinophaga sp. 30R24]|uniref:tetratricopeptide repeat protein n=1 Tax=Chitinophaga sp. 30R24 TaxID=3248838 RepID=UPI003B909768